MENANDKAFYVVNNGKIYASKQWRKICISANSTGSQSSAEQTYCRKNLKVYSSTSKIYSSEYFWKRYCLLELKDCLEIQIFWNFGLKHFQSTTYLKISNYVWNREKVCKTTAVQCYKFFSLLSMLLLVFIASIADKSKMVGEAEHQEAKVLSG